MMGDSGKSNSYEQQQAELVVFELVQEWLIQEYPTVRLQSNPKLFIGKSYIQPDFYSEENGIIGEIFVHIGKTKKAQENKISNDILKMLLLEKVRGKTYRKIIVVCDDVMEAKINGSSILAEYIRQFDVAVKRIYISDELRENLIQAQDRQKMVNW